MARVNHKRVKQLLNEKRSRITDRQFFTSRILAGHFEDMAMAQTRRYKYNRRIHVAISWSPKSGEVACTNNLSVLINAGHRLVTQNRGRENRYEIVCGLFAHELGHCLYTDFLAGQTYNNYLSREKWYPEPPAYKLPKDTVSERALWEYVRLEPRNNEMLRYVAHHISNVIEDAYILCIVVELNEILLQEWRERRYASIKQPTIIQANLFGKLEIISATDVLKDDSFTNESGYVLLTFLLLNRKREHPLRLLTDVIWESTDMGNPYNSIKNVVYRLRKTLACIGLRDLIQASHGTFTLNPNYTIFTDVERFDDACKRIDNSSDQVILQTLYESIIGLYRGSLLPRYDFYHWLMPKTLYYQNKFLHYMKRYLSMLYREKNYLRVQELSMDLLSIDMYESEVHYYLIKAMLKSGSKTLSQIYFRQAEPYLTDEHMQEVKTLFTSCRT